MAGSRTEIRDSYPLPAYNYRVTIIDGGHAETIGFSEISGLSTACEPVTYRDGLSFLDGPQIVPGLPKPVAVTLRKGLARRGDYLQQWFDGCRRAPRSPGARRDVLIDLCDERGTPAIRWKVGAALPVRLEAPTFAASGNEVAIASLELVASHVQVDFRR